MKRAALIASVILTAWCAASTPARADGDCLDEVWGVYSATECALACESATPSCCTGASYSCTTSEYYSGTESCYCVTRCPCSGGGGGGGGGGPVYECNDNVDCWPTHGVGSVCEIHPWGSQCVAPWEFDPE